MKSKALLLIVTLSIFLIPLAQANMIEDVLQNEFMRTAMSFVVFFAVIFFALKKILFGEERMINTIVSLIISYFAAVAFSNKLGEWVLNSKYMYWTYIVFFIFGLFLLGRALFGLFGAGEKINRLKWLAGIYFIIWLFYLTNIISYEPVQDFIYNLKSSMPSYIANLINILGVISGIIFVFNLYGWIRVLIKGSTEAERLEKEKNKFERIKLENAELEEKNRRAAREHELETQKIELKKEKKRLEAEKELAKMKEKRAKELRKARELGPSWKKK